MANNGFAGFDPEQVSAVVEATESLAKKVEDTIAAATDQFRSALVSTDRVLGECEYKDEVAQSLPAALEQVKDDINIQAAFDTFSGKVKDAEAVIGSTIVRNTENAEAAQANLKAQAKKAGENVGR